ncbi:MAG: HupE/UreJ family protein [Planctomycetes bacterium]|nr:HupE/UreJ family protein [Planctomycetota bacterium]
MIVWASVLPAQAHETRSAYLELTQTGEDTYDVFWRVPARGDLRLGIYVRLPSECQAISGTRGGIVDAVSLERWSIRCPGSLTDKTIAIDGLSATTIDVLVRVVRRDGKTQTTRLSPSAPSFVVAASPSQWQVAVSFLKIGIEHILLGVDHLLFVLGLLLIVSGRLRLLKTITAFTVAHSLTLALATLGYARVPVPPLNAAIALSILFLGPEIVRVWRGETSFTIRHPWVVAFLFGLLHGFGFASGLSELGISGSELVFGLLMFNVGVEIGQIGFVLIILALLDAFRTLEIRWPRWAEYLPGYAVGTLGAFWTLQRVALAMGLVT